MRPTPTLIGALLLVLLTNAVVLLGVAWNRRGEPDAVLALSERELLTTVSEFLPDEENSGLSLRLNWAVDPPRGNDKTLYAFGPSRWSEAAWLDRDKLAALGFDVSIPPASSAALDHYSRMLAREALLVLELDGPAYQAALAHLREDAERARACAAANAQDPRSPLCGRAYVEAHEEPPSRLFVVDAGLDGRALRQRYPDRNRYAIVRGAARPRLVGDPHQPGELYGSVTALHGEDINVPPAFLARLAPRLRGTTTLRLTEPLRVTIAFGARHEPWIVSAAAP